nr:uncharacterized protein K02A2.6-like [Parasteatoda tepidariorum]
MAPVRCKARSMPLAMRSKIEAALAKLQSEAVIEEISNPKWSTPAVPVIKPSGEIDLAQAYLQLPVDDASAEAQAIITHKGAYKIKRLQFGINVVPGIFQNLIEDLFQKLEGVVPYFDDVLVRGSLEEELAARLRKAGLKANGNKCLFGGKATKAEVLHRLLDRDSVWKWSEVHDEAFRYLKELSSSEVVLVPFDEKLQITLVCDASPFGVGAVLSHVRHNGCEAPIAFAPRTLTSTERNYAQIDKEALPLHISPRMLRWSLILNAYDYTPIHGPGKKIQNADSLSRLLKDTDKFEVPGPLEVLFTENLQDPPLQAAEIAKLTLRDPILSRVLNWAFRGWPNEKPDKKCQTFFSKRNELSTHRNCLLWGNRVVIPVLGKSRVLQALHLGHSGIERMKALARLYAWWPGMDYDIEVHVQGCHF